MIRSSSPFLVYSNPGKAVYGEKLISVDSPPNPDGTTHKGLYVHLYWCISVMKSNIPPACNCFVFGVIREFAAITITTFELIFFIIPLLFS